MSDITFLSQPISAEESASATGFDNTPVEPGEYEMEVRKLSAQRSKAGNIYMTIQLGHTGENKRHGSVFFRINRNHIGNKQLAQFIEAALGVKAVGYNWGTIGEEDERGRLAAGIGDSDGVDVTNSLLGKTVTAKLKIDTSGQIPRNDVSFFVVRKS